LVHFVIHPLHVVLALVGAGLALRALGLRRTGAVTLWTAGVLVAIVSLTPAASWLAYAIENRVARGALDLDAVAGVIVLGGATGDPVLVEAHGDYQITDAAERLTTLVALR